MKQAVSAVGIASLSSNRADPCWGSGAQRSRSPAGHPLVPTGLPGHYFRSKFSGLLVVLGFVEDHMGQTGTDDGAEEEVGEQFVSCSVRMPLTTEDPVHDLIPDQKTGRKTPYQWISQWMKLQQDWIKIPVKHCASSTEGEKPCTG